ncbi:MAG: S46 family peptidase [Flavobacteriales bacterium]|nr:S46 family peptidase [Flavobacteriales bacterium]
MKKIILCLLVAVFVLPMKANEGMWFLMHIERLNYVDMQKMGLQLTPEEIYSVNNNSLKDAIVQFGGGCTAEIISKNGLVLTNHHCGYGQIAELSTAENDYLTNGFWAKNYGEELKPQNLSVRFFIRMDDVTKRILALVNDEMSELEREKVINQEIAKIDKENNEDGKYIVSVRPFYSGNEYYYFVYQDFTDVRLVGTPPNSIGKFGGDTDNWEWPRHTGDFALFRVYGDKKGNPATYSESNVPLQPKYHLPVSTKGIQENDFAMILGYPGRTNRWMPAAGIDQNVKFAYPAWVEGSKTAMDAMKPHMDANAQVRLDYASSYASIANYWKNRQGMIEALTQHKTAQTKRTNENIFNAWANSKVEHSNTDLNSETMKTASSLGGVSKEKTATQVLDKPTIEDLGSPLRYKDVMQTINSYYASTNQNSMDSNYLITLLRSSRWISIPTRLERILTQLFDENNTEITSEMFLEKYESEIDNLYKGLYAPLEKDVLKTQLELYVTKTTKPIGILYNAWLAQKEGAETFDAFIEKSIRESVFESPEKLKAFISNPDQNKLRNDPLLIISTELYAQYRYKSEEDKQRDDDFQKAYRMMIQGMREMNPNETYYPDANSTLRLSYGKVRALPRGTKQNDAKENYFTTLKGTVAKYQPGDQEFDMPKKLIDLYNAKDFGAYADKAGHMPVNFLTDHDITGGNSGSPVLNGKGELIGLAFDGNIEAMAGDVIFDDELQRAINVDVRYILFIIDKYAGAKHLVDEMTIRK